MVWTSGDRGDARWSNIRIRILCIVCRLVYFGCMKTVALLLVSLSLLAGSDGALKIPRTVFELDRLEEAQAEAKEKGKGLAFVTTDPGSS